MKSFKIRFLHFYFTNYGTAQFKLEARVWVTHVYFITPLEYFSKLCVSVDNCTRISRAIHARVMSPNILAYVRACTHVTMHAHSRKEFRSPSNSVQCASVRDDNPNVHVHQTYVHGLKMAHS